MSGVGKSEAAVAIAVAMEAAHLPPESLADAVIVIQRLAADGWVVRRVDEPGLREAIALLEEVYGHTSPTGDHLAGPEVKIWVHRSTIDSMGDRIAALRAVSAVTEPTS